MDEEKKPTEIEHNEEWLFSRGWRKVDGWKVDSEVVDSDYAFNFFEDLGDVATKCEYYLNEEREIACEFLDDAIDTEEEYMSESGLIDEDDDGEEGDEAEIFDDIDKSLRTESEITPETLLDEGIGEDKKDAERIVGRLNFNIGG
jgi:hypothetical protein